MFDQVINKGNYDAAAEFFAPDFLDHGPMGDVQGVDAFVALVKAWRGAVPDVHCTVENVISDGEKLRASYVRRAPTPATDLAFQQPGSVSKPSAPTTER